ncbi:MAG: GNAT family N-acetyltransferase [Flavobacteriales bacterium]|nr:GNAT family N-acetyltransferase [Flavobacteriales bacterium]
MKLAYRNGTKEDTAALQALGILAYSQHQFAMTTDNWKKYHSFMSDPENFTYLMSTSTCFLCECDQDIIGMAFLVPSGNPTNMFEKQWSYIRMVAVHPKFEGKGVAKKLTQMCIDLARTTGEEYVALHTSEFMNAARHIYEGFGFTAVRTLKRYDKKYWIYLLELKTEHHDPL